MTNNPFANLTKYELDHLAAHLEAAGRGDDLHQLLVRETSERRNAWYEVKDIHNDTAGYISDINRALGIAEKEYLSTNIATRGRVIGLQCHYALIIVSINSITNVIPVDVLIAMLRRNIWTPEQVLEHISRISPQYDQRMRALEAIIPYLPTSILQGVLSESIVRGASITVPVLMNLAANLPVHDRFDVLQQALKTAQMTFKNITDDIDCNSDDDDDDDDGTEGYIHNDLDEVRQAEVLTDLASQFSLLGHLDWAIQAARSIKRIYRRAKALAMLIPNLSGSLKDDVMYEALVAVYRYKSCMESWYDQIDAMLTLSPFLSQLERDNVLHEVIRQAEMLIGNWSMWGYSAKGSIRPNADLLSRIVKLGYVNDALALARLYGNNDRSDRIIALTTLLPCLPEVQRNDVICELLGIVQANKSLEGYKKIAFSKLVPYLPEPAKSKIAHNILEMVSQSKDDIYYTKESFVNLSFGAIQFRKQQAGEITSIGYKILTESAAYMAQSEYFREFIELILEKFENNSKIMIAISEYLASNGFYEESLKIAQTIKDENWCRMKLLELFICLSDQSRNLLLPEIYEIVLAIQTIDPSDNNTIEMKDIYELPGKLIALIPHVASSLKKDIQISVLKLSAMISDSDVHIRVEILLKLEHHLEDFSAYDIIREILAITRIIGDDIVRSKVVAKFITGIVKNDDPKETIDAIFATQRITDGYLRVRTLAESISFLIEPMKSLVIYESLIFIQKTNENEVSAVFLEQRLDIALMIAPYISESLNIRILSDILDLVKKKLTGDNLAEALVKLAHYFPEPSMSQLVNEAFDATDSVYGPVPSRRDEEKSRYELVEQLDSALYEAKKRAIAKMIPYLPNKFIDKAMSILTPDFRLDSDKYDTSYSTGIANLKLTAPFMSEEKIYQIIDNVKSIDNNIKRTNVLTNVLVVLLPYLAKVGHPQQALDMADKIEDVGYRTRVLAALGLYLPRSLLLPTFTQIPRIPEIEERLNACESLNQGLAVFPPDDPLLYRLWIESLHTLASYTRELFLERIHSLIAVIAMLGGVEALKSTLHSIEDVGRWWP